MSGDSVLSREGNFERSNIFSSFIRMRYESNCSAPYVLTCYITTVACSVVCSQLRSQEMYPCSVNFCNIKDEYMYSYHFWNREIRTQRVHILGCTGISSQTGATSRGIRKAGANSESDCDFVSRAPPPNEANSLRPQQDNKVVAKEKPL